MPNVTQSIKISIDSETLNIMQDKENQRNAADDYLNVSKLNEGNFVFRILGPIRSSWDVWTKDNNGNHVKNIFHPQNKAEAVKCTQDQKPTFTFFFQIYCVKEKSLKLLFVTQASLQKELINIITHSKEEDLSLCTFIINKKAGDKFPVYTLSRATTMGDEGIPIVYKSPIPSEAEELMKSIYCDLNEVYEKRSPFYRAEDEINCL